MSVEGLGFSSSNVAVLELVIFHPSLEKRVVAYLLYTDELLKSSTYSFIISLVMSY